jgi:GNAT superfamily N-acetyltransferase
MDTDPLARIVPAARVDDRVTIRYRLDDGSATDVVGWITRLGSDVVEVVSPGNRRAVVERRQIILARRVPPARGGRPPERWSADELERAAARGWIADHRPLGSWLLRSGNGFTNRANSCLAVGDPGTELPRAAGMIIDFYTAHELEPKAQVVTGSATERQFRELGWQPTGIETTVMTIPLSELIGDHRRDQDVRLDPELADDWWQGYLEYRPIPDHDVARRLLTGPPPVALAAVRRDDQVVSVGRGQVSDEWLGIAGLWTRPAYRRRGLATKIIIELGHWAARTGARNAYLQVETKNTGAVAAYRSLGFRPHHEYRYLRPAD